MKNTGITYTSAERSPVILPEMAELLPPLSAEQSAALEEDLLRNGCYSPVIVNEDMVIVDGHNRQSLCEKHGLPYTMAVFSFEDLLEAKQWALDTQKGRRNLEKWELGKIALKLKPEIEAKARANQSAAGGDKSDKGALLTTLSEALPSVSTRKELADAVGIGEVTMGKVMQIDENAPEVIKEALDKKELSINKGYDLTRQLQDLPEEQREQAAAEALEESVIDGAGAAQQLTGDIASLVQCLEELQKAVHCRLADGFSIRQTAHPVRYHGKHPPAGHGLRVRGVHQGKGILLPLPGTDALDVSHQNGSLGHGAAELLRGGVIRHPAGPAEKVTDPSHGRPLPAST